MKLTHFRVQNYKVIDDTGWVPLNLHVTALVGKNEIGKTAILRAIWKAKNVAHARFDKLLDYPRERYAKERKGTQEVVSLQFELSEAEAGLLASHFPFSLKQKPHIAIFATFYNGEEQTSVKVGFEDKVEKLCARPSAEARKAVQGVADAITKATGKEDPSIVGAIDSALPRFDESLPLGITLLCRRSMGSTRP
jgi:predicted ATP-dependent endonuclease of OLD family